MNLPPEAIAEFKQCYFQEHGIQLTDDDAHRLAHELYTLGKTLVDMAHQNDKAATDNELPNSTQKRST
jgi:hypothetical protein